jgi:hypothetical protein
MLIGSAPASAATIWTDWLTAQNGGPGSATGNLGGVSVSYSGGLVGSVLNGFSNVWAPPTTYVGGVVDTSPASVGDDLRLNGAFTGVNTITFATPVINPLFAIWSLGQPGFAASFSFNQTPTFVVGGPNSQFGGSAINVAGNTVSGFEGNGIVQFIGTFNSISWTNSFENFYAFTVGSNGEREVPEPASLLLVASGVLGVLARRRSRA